MGVSNPGYVVYTIYDGSDRTEYTRKSQLTEDESKRHIITKVHADGNKLRAEKEWWP